MCRYLRSGDLFDTLNGLTGGAPYDVVWLDNVLEHVVDPAQMLTDIRKLTSPFGILVIEVPNDFSRTQKALLSSGQISRPFWVVMPDHLSYFNKEGLTGLADATGWELKRLIGDFPIDFNLFNPDTNYIEDRSKGKRCHQARVAIENLIHGISPDGANRLYEVLGDLGLGRNIVAFFQLKSPVQAPNS
jgi:SAM-dependent methyltransferase